MTRHQAKLATMRMLRAQARRRQKLIWAELKEMATAAAIQAVEEIADEAGDGGTKAIKLCEIWDRHIDPDLLVSDVFEAVHDALQDTMNFPYELHG